MQHVWNSRPGVTRDGKREVRRRHRATLSCERCRRLKVKCDRNLPCSQCQRSKVAESCRYCRYDMMSKPESGSGQQKQTRVRDDPQTALGLSTPSETALSKPMDLVFSAGADGGGGDMFEQRAVPPPGMTFADTSLSSSSSLSFAEQLEAALLAGSSHSPLDMTTRKMKTRDKQAWISKTRGETHWAAFLKEFRAISPDSPKLHKSKSHKIPKKEKADVGFANDEDLRPLAEQQRPREFILSIIPNRETADLCVENYFSTVERIYRLLHIPSFRREVRSFWDDHPEHNSSGSSTPPWGWDWDWLAQLLMVIGLGYYSMTSSAEADADMKQVKRLYKGAELCLMRASFIMRPTILTVKTLCMMVVAKHIGAMSCEAYDSCGPLMGIAIRHAMTMGLHRDQSSTHGCGGGGDADYAYAAGFMQSTTKWEIEMRRRLWTTIAQIEIQQSIVSGVPPVLRAYDFDVSPPSNLNDDDFDPSSPSSDHGSGDVGPRSDLEYTDSSFQFVLARSLNPVLEIVAAANLRGIAVTNYDKFMALDGQIRELLAEVSALREKVPQYQDSSHGQGHGQTQTWTTLQIFTLEMLFRRTLLTLHWRSSQHPNARTHHPTSYWASLECSLAILVHQRELYENYSQIWQSTQWFAELFKNDLLLATMFVGIQLCRKDCSCLDGEESEATVSPPSPSPSPSSSPSLSLPLPLPLSSCCGCTTPAMAPRSTILEALKSCRDIWASNLRRSRCQSKAYGVMEEVIRSVEYGL